METITCKQILEKDPELVCCQKCHDEGDPSYYFQLNNGQIAKVCCFIATSAEQGMLENWEGGEDVE